MRRWILAAFIVVVINTYGGTVNIHLKNGSIFTCNKIVTENKRFIVVENEGKKLLLNKVLIKKIEKVISPKKNKKISKNVKKDKKKNNEKDNVLVIDETNFVRTTFFDPYAKLNKEDVKQAPDTIKIKVLNQKVEREGNKIKFEGMVQNIFGKDVDSLKMIVSALDSEGNIVVENASQIAPKLKDGEKAPFSFVFSNTDLNIQRFTYSFEAYIIEDK